MSEMGIKKNEPSTLHIDNQSVIHVAKNPEHHSCMKQLYLKFFWLHDAVECNIIIPSYMHTDQMPADILTKPLPKVRVDALSKLLELTKLKDAQLGGGYVEISLLTVMYLGV